VLRPVSLKYKFLLLGLVNILLKIETDKYSTQVLAMLSNAKLVISHDFKQSVP
jgi:hypothetical protein